MPPLSQSHQDRPLTDFALAVLAEDSDFVVGNVSPIVPVDHLSDTYYILGRNAFARGDARPRGPNQESAGFDFALSTNPYRCLPYALHTDVPRIEVENADDPDLIERGAVRLVLDNLRLTHEVGWTGTFFTPGVWSTAGGNADVTGGTAGYPFWNDYGNSDPKAQIKKARRLVMVNGGRVPNVLVLGYDAWLALEDHPLIVDRIKHVTEDAVSEQIVAKYLGVDKVIVLRSTRATNNPGQAETFDFVHGKHALLTYVPNGVPTKMTPSAMLTFSWKGTSGGGVMNADGTAAIKVIDKPLHNALRYEAQMNWADVITGPLLAQFFANIVQ